MRHAKYNIRNTKNGPRVTPQDAYRRSHQSRMNVGSALILAVVLTSLLAIVGALFVMMARVNKIASSGLSESKELDAAIETVIAKISDELALDVPHNDPCRPREEYYDYPDVNNAWLASLEPYDKPGVGYCWRQISDVTGFLERKVFGKGDVDVELPSAQRPKPSEAWVRDYPQINVDENGDFLDKDGALAVEGLWADADGDGVADSKWVELDDITSSKGRPIYAAIRIIDNGGMLNVNTAYKFDPGGSQQEIDGSSQMQINLMALSWRPPDYNTYDLQSESDLLEARCGDGAEALYEQNVIWRYGEPNGPYTPFDISDELELRNRFLLNHTDIDTRLEDWGGEFRKATSSTPFESLNEWFKSAYDNGSFDPNYAYRHIATTYNMDRIIDPNGDKMTNINDANVDDLYDSIRRGLLDANYPDVNGVAAQIAVNLRDFRDNDSNVTTFLGDTTYYGFETQPFISEIGFLISNEGAENPSNNNYFALELYNPFEVDIPLDDFRLELRLAGDPDPKYTVNLVDSVAANSRFVITNSATASSAFGISADQVDPNLVLATYTVGATPGTYVLSERYDIYLLRTTAVGTSIYLDKQNTQDEWFDWNVINGELRFYYRPDNNWNIVYQDLDPNDNGTLNGSNGGGTEKNYNIPTFTGGFVTVGDIARPLIIGPNTTPDSTIGWQLALATSEKDIRIDLADPNFQQIFNYLTVIDPAVYPWNNPNEARIKGRVNINTAPWYVLAQLPWMQYTAVGDDYQRAQEIAKNGPYENIGELMRVAKMGSLNSDGVANLNTDDPKGPDLTDDDALNDFEERDLIFSRISNLVTVRSDVFTAYILVRIGTDGPQKRVIAILDRSDVYSPADRVKIVAVHPVADPR